jgi:hypothetical protein
LYVEYCRVFSTCSTKYCKERLAGGAAGTVQGLVRVITRSYAYKTRAVPAVGLVCAHRQGVYVSEYQGSTCTRKNRCKQVLNVCRY